MKSALARKLDEVIDAAPAFECAALMGTRCSSCGEVIRVAANAGASDLVELQCNRCGANDVYHVKCLRPLSALLGPGGGN